MSNMDSNVFRMYFSTLKTGMMIESSLTLYRIHETLLDLVEDDDSQCQKYAHENETIYKPSPADKLSGTEESIFKRLDNRGYRVEAHKGMDRNTQEKLAPGLAEWINDRGRIHPERNKE